MKHLFPGRAELLIFGTLAVVCAVIASMARSHDLGLSGLSVPLFIAAAVMGLRRNWELTEAEGAADVQIDDDLVG